MFWEENFTQVNMKSRGCRNVIKQREIKNGEQHVVLYISLKFGNLDEIKNISSEPKDYLVKSGKGLIAYMGIKVVISSKMFKSKILPLLNSVSRIFLILWSNLRMRIMRIMQGRGPNTCLLTYILQSLRRVICMAW